DPAEGGASLTKAVVDVGAQGVQRDPTLAVSLTTGHLRTTETPRALDAHPEGTGFGHRLHGALHGPAEGHTAGQLVGDALCDQRGIELGLLDLLDVELDAVAKTGDVLELLLEAIGF